MSTPDDDVDVHVCRTYRGHWEMDQAPPGWAIRRANCGHLVWMAATGQRFAEAHPDAYLMCLDCIPEKAMRTFDGRAMLPGAEAELRGLGIEPAAIERVKRRLGLDDGLRPDDR